MTDKTNPTLEQFLSAIFNEVPEGELVCLSMAGAKRTEPWRGQRVHRMRTSTYYAPFTLKPTAAEERQNDDGSSYTFYGRTVDDIACYYAVVIDDVGTKTGTPPVEPSYKLESSAGNFQWGYILDPEDDLEKVNGFWAGLREAGLTDEGAAKLTQPFRVPGSYHKTGFRARITEWHPERFWEIDELAEALGFTIEPVSVRKKPPRATQTPDGYTDPVAKWLVENEHVTGESRFGLVIRCPWREEHTDPSDDMATGYSPLGEGGEYALMRAFKCQHGHCRNRKTTEFLQWVAEEGGPEVAAYAPHEFLLERYVLIEEGRKVGSLDPDDPRPVRSWEEFAMVNAMPVKLGKSSVSAATAFKREARSVRALRYAPERRSVIVEHAGVEWYNEYRRPQHEETQAPPETFLEHVEYLLPNEAEREYFLDWLAYKAQHPGSRSPAVLMVADNVYGIGRSTLGDAIADAFGHGVKPLTFEQFAGTGSQSQFDDWQHRLLIGIVDEAVDSDAKAATYRVKSAAYELIKARVDTRVGRNVTVNKKGGTTWLTDVFANYLIFTNHPDAFPIPPGDRRLSVLENPAKKQSSGYYERVREALPREAGAIWWWLQHRDVSQYNPGVPLETGARQRMIAANQTELDDIVETMLEELPGCVITLDHWLQQIRSRSVVANFCLLPDGWERAAAKMWRRLKYPYDDRDAARVVIKGKRTRARVVRIGPVLTEKKGQRNYSRWLSKEAERNQPAPRDASSPFGKD